MMDSPSARGVVLALLAYAFFAVSDASVKLLHGGLDPFQVSFIGALLGFSVLPFIHGRGMPWRSLLATRRRGLWLLRGLMAALGSVCSVTAFTRLPMAEAFALLFLLPTFVTILSVLFLKEQVGWRRWSAVIVGFAGVLIVLRPGFRELTLGHVAAIIGGFAGAVTVVLMRALGRTESRASLYLSGLLGILAVCGALMLPNLAWPSAMQWVWLLGYGLLAAVAGVLIQAASAAAPVSLTAPTQYSQMLWAIGFGYWVFGDRLDVWTFAGAAVIVGSGLFTLARERARRSPGGGGAPPVRSDG
ncbi:DMT family transporter [Roseomonas sp. OT10]|uniref:DMT family transporter n=1 Tax=Roseomonas cutis TaxID=2897332 RepID=UPI001E3DDB5D|nr:DMT family transporter [Roseomonas sp. OT10]UFN50451.1 DMT family transporter [Roseomonas sp. OT10]